MSSNLNIAVNKDVSELTDDEKQLLIDNVAALTPEEKEKCASILETPAESLDEPETIDDVESKPDSDEEDENEDEDDEDGIEDEFEDEDEDDGEMGEE